MEKEQNLKKKKKECTMWEKATELKDWQTSRKSDQEKLHAS